MKCVKLSDCHFHDSVIKNIDYNEKTLKLFIPDNHYENAYRNLIVEMQIDKNDISCYYIRQYPRCHEVKLKGKEISICFLQSLLKRKHMLEVLEFLVSADTNRIIFECIVFPYSSRPGVYEKIFLQLDYEHNYLIFKDIDENKVV